MGVDPAEVIDVPCDFGSTGATLEKAKGGPHNPSHSFLNCDMGIAVSFSDTVAVVAAVGVSAILLLLRTVAAEADLDCPPVAILVSERVSVFFEVCLTGATREPSISSVSGSSNIPGHTPFTRSLSIKIATMSLGSTPSGTP
jgi:hypothetical protein